MIATRLNRALKTEQQEFKKLCLVLLCVGTFMYLLNVKLLVILSLIYVVIIWRNMMVENQRIFTCGNKYTSFLILNYLAGKSNSTEISDVVAEEYNNLDQSTRNKINHRLDFILLLLYSVPVIIYYYWTIK